MSSYKKQIEVLSDPATRTVFDRVVQRRSVRMRDLVSDLDQSLSPSGEDDAENVGRELERLKQAGLVAEKKSTLRSLDRYFVTADGLNAKRELF